MEQLEVGTAPDPVCRECLAVVPETEPETESALEWLVISLFWPFGGDGDL